MMSGSPVGNFYIYSFDGNLLQVYDVYGHLLKDYIYMGDRLIAEYDYVGSRYLYYTPDQINTTRVVTDGVGNVVYSAVHDPYGGIQQTGAGNTYDPQLKFSGKERDAESQLDYFGARYYDRSQYRFISVDPILSFMLDVSVLGHSLYSYCLDNPQTCFDPDGRATIILTIRPLASEPFYGVLQRAAELGTREGLVAGFCHTPTEIDVQIVNENGKYHAEVTIRAEIEQVVTRETDDIFGKPGMPKDYDTLVKHEEEHLANFGTFLQNVTFAAEQLEMQESKSKLMISIEKQLFYLLCEIFGVKLSIANSETDAKKDK